MKGLVGSLTDLFHLIKPGLENNRGGVGEGGERDGDEERTETERVNLEQKGFILKRREIGRETGRDIDLYIITKRDK